MVLTTLKGCDVNELEGLLGIVEGVLGLVGELLTIDQCLEQTCPSLPQQCSQCNC
jgi:hypothetical protein